MTLEERRLAEREDDKLWDYMIKQDEYVVQEFFTAVIGIGALFFAYGSITQSPYIRLAVAFIGLGASVIVWTHEVGAHKQAAELKKVIGPTRLMQRWNEALEWRGKSWYKYVYHPSTRLMAYFSALVTLAWVLIIINDAATLSKWSIPTEYYVD